MSKAAHTVGPWKISGRAGYTGHSVKGADGRSVAAFPSTSTRPKEERDANARLIAAAPDLLAALERIAYSAHADTAPILRGYAQDAIAAAKGGA